MKKILAPETQRYHYTTKLTKDMKDRNDARRHIAWGLWFIWYRVKRAIHHQLLANFVLFVTFVVRSPFPIRVAALPRREVG